VVTEKLHALRGKSDAPDFSDATLRKLAILDVLHVLEIGHALRSESWQPGRLRSNLSWAHYRTLLRVDKALALATIQSEFPSVTDFEKEFSSFCFALSIRVGKTRLMDAFISVSGVSPECSCIPG
jgi:hypothetical protein